MLSENSEPTMCFSQTTLDEKPRRQRLADGQLSSPYTPPLSFSSFGAASVIMHVVPLVLLLRVHPYGRVCYPRIGLVVNMMYIRIFCDHINVIHIFDQTCIVLKSGWSSTMGPPHC